jgi:ATP-dependent helicase/nuclease subunit A
MRKDAAAAPRLTDEDSRRIIREELNTNLLVEAGAGSGKTQMLAERMAAGIAAGVYDIEHLAAVTFTRKAASELRGRFHIALEKRLAAHAAARNAARDVARNFSSADTDAAASATASTAANADTADARLSHALSTLERFFAGTIHSFCARLLRERPVEAGVAPGFTELDEVQDEDVRTRAWREFISSTRAAGDRQMLELLDTGVRPGDLDGAFATICLNEDVEFTSGDGVCPDPKPAWKALEQFWKDLQKVLPARIPDDTTCPTQLASETFARQLRVARKLLDRPSTMAELLKTWDFEPAITQNRWATATAEKKRFKELITGLHRPFRDQVVTPYLAQWRQYVYRLSVGVLTGARDYAAAERRRRNALNYGDLLVMTAKVLRENAQVRRALQARYRHLFVDEFQDTDPIQAEIVFLLAADDVARDSLSAGALAQADRPAAPDAVAQAFRPAGPTAAGARAETNWQTLPIRRGALFVVGDPKQSIYRFRRADIEIYNIVRARFSDPAVGRVVPLTTNFRSVPALCTWANTVFDGPFPKDPTEHSPRFAPLDALDDASKAKSGGVFIVTHQCETKEVPEHDAAAIARYIRSEVDAGRRSFSDFLILTRRKKDRLAPYAAALERLNVPIEVSGAGAFGDSAEVKVLTSLLRALADPQDALPLVAVLRGPLFGVSDPELFAFRQAGGWFSIYYEPKADIAKELLAGHDAVAGALSALRQYHRWTRLLPAGAALDRILEHTGYLALAATTPGGVEAGDLLHAVDRVRQVFDDGGSLDEAADALEADGEFTSEVESLPLEPGRTDVVRLMNLHKAKGLEAQVVFLADPTGGLRPRADVHIERRGNQALGWFKVVKKFEGGGAITLGEHADWARHEAAELPFLQAEETRLLYVAATRAREMLVVSRHVPPKGTPAWGVLNAHLTAAKALPIPADVTVAALQALDCSKETQALERAALDAAHTRAVGASWSITSVTGEAHHIARITRAAESSPDDPTRVVSPTTAAHRADAGMAWGTLIHGLLEHAMRHKGATAEDLRRLAMWLTVEEPQLRWVVDVAVGIAVETAKADFWAGATSSTHSEEVPFSHETTNRALTSGVIDLLYRDALGWNVIDYKTDAVLGPDRLAVYRRQVDAYLDALRACGITSTHGDVKPVQTPASPSA